MTVEAYHDWGCGALNGTAPCSCGEGWTDEAINREAMRKDKNTPPNTTSEKPTMAESLRRLDDLANSLKAQS